VDTLASSLATKNKASAELIVSVYNSDNGTAKKFLKSQMDLFEKQQ